jgi:hypothetical protein
MNRVSFFLFLVFALTACLAPNGGAPQTAEQPEIKKSSLPDLGVAPELTNTVWLNTDQALRLADLRGKVVLLDMWTFG